MARDDVSAAELAQRSAQMAWAWAAGPGRLKATALALRLVDRIRRNLVPRRLFSLPHLLVFCWFIAILWGERWIFESKVESCEWENWESWPKGAKPHHLVFLADPQIIDPHTYPGRPWPLSSLTFFITDTYLRRGYKAVQTQLHPDSVFLLGDLFDGGREWKTRRGEFVDPPLGRAKRAKDELGQLDKWHRKYGEDFWLAEYKRFGDIFFDMWNMGGDTPGSWQRGRKLVASLPGNHDLGFGAQVQAPVRDRFTTFFGDLNRVDVVGNHTIVSVDGLSLSAGSSEYKDSHDLRPIYEPVNDFLEHVKAYKRKAVQEELGVWYGPERDLRYAQEVEELDTADLGRFPQRDPGAAGSELPTILLTHVPLYRAPGTPCGPKREHWPPAKPPKGQAEPVVPDHRNAISISAGYQYQNVLSEQDSVKLVKSVGNVVHVFSGDDHDYCELVHGPTKDNVREITVKSMSMAMGVPTPGFVMASLYNPVDEHGKPLSGAAGPTLQTHLCLLPNQIHTYMQYVFFLMLTLVMLLVRAFLVPVLNLQPFALEADASASSPTAGAMLPLYREKQKLEARQTTPFRSSSSSSSSSRSGTRARSSSLAGSGQWQPKRSNNRGGPLPGPRIHLDEDFYDGGKSWKAGQVRGRSVLATAGREMWTTTWRVTWMAVLFWVYLN
ncbi:putative manganese ion homeostasis [Stachybotrys elegans]|uniref:Manganese ion homeostasis n=1 Tax=Stachybotrys elegans TaxID=80388 RepID=A0A8K0SNI2_9HYPO|nr:putative manganese ion homeostasis [Stachybotrys elegans]